MTNLIYKRENGVHILITEVGTFRSEHSRESVEQQYEHEKRIRRLRENQRQELIKLGFLR